MSAIHNVLDIAKAVPTFPVVMQWTGGRGGGHHSFEDMHQPILDSYPAIRYGCARPFCLFSHVSYSHEC